MTDISSISSKTPDFTNIGKQDVTMGKEDFLKLLVAQLQHQDPLNPADPTEFTAQLAQFGQLEQLTNANKSLEQLGSMSGEMKKMSALSLIGQDVVAESENLRVSGEPMTLGYSLDAPAEDVTLYVQDVNGATVATLPAEGKAAGEYFVAWDGVGDNGTPVAPGDYSLIAHAVDGEEKRVKTTSLIMGRVQSVDLSGADVQLDTSSGSFAMSKVTQAGGS